MKLVVTGGRDLTDRLAVYETLDLAHEILRIDLLAHGHNPRGLDAFADGWAHSRGIACLRFPADWSRGRRGGPVRNRKMLRAVRPDVVLAFPGKDGTADCVKAARELGLHVLDLRETLRFLR